MTLLLLGSGIVGGTVAAGAMLWLGAGILTTFAAYALGGMVGMVAGVMIALNRTDPSGSAPSSEVQGCFARETSGAQHPA